MGWADKALKKAREEKLVADVVNSRAYRQQKKKEDLRMFALLGFISCDYLELKHRYKRNGFMNFLKFANERMRYISTDNEYYIDDMNSFYKEEHGIDMLKWLGIDSTYQSVGCRVNDKDTRWIIEKHADRWMQWDDLTCPDCGEVFEHATFNKRNFCPACGGDMRKEHKA